MSNLPLISGVHERAAGAAPFVGRTAELAAVERALGEARLVTLLGPGGNGKTRLALELAARSDGGPWGGSCVVDLAPLRSERLVALAVLEAVGGVERPGSSPLDVAADCIGQAPALLVLDNCEHVVGAAGEAVQSLLGSCAGLRALATSRVPLGLDVESEWTVPAMSLPPEDGDVAELVVCDAGRLFVACAARGDATFVLNADSAPVIARICRELEGVPLAIDLAASGAAWQPLELIADEVADRVARLDRTGRAAGAEHHRSLRASLDWSHALLDDGDRAALRRVAVFTGGCSLDAAEEVCELEGSVADRLRSLEAKGLLHGAGGRYLLLETVRGYALERLAEAGEEEIVRARHLRWCRQLADSADALSGRVTGLDALEREMPNLRAAIDWALERDPVAALELAAGLGRYWIVSDRFEDGRAICRRVLERAPERESRLRALVEFAAGTLAGNDQDYEAAQEHAAAGVAAAESSGDSRAIGLSMVMLTSMLIGVDISRAEQSSQRALELLRGTGDELAFGLGLVCVAQIETLLDRVAEVRRCYGELTALPAAREDPFLRALAESAMAFAELTSGSPAAVLDHSDEVLARRPDRTSMLSLIAISHRVQALALLGRSEEAREEGEAALEAARRARQPHGAAALDLALAFSDLARGEHESAGERARPLTALPLLHTAARACEIAARAAVARGEASPASEQAAALRAIASRTGSSRQAALADQLEGAAALMRGEPDVALGFLHAALAVQAEEQLGRDATTTLELLAAVAGELGQAARAGRLLGAAASARRALRCVAVPGEGEREHALRRRCSELLGEQAWATALAEGEATDLWRAVAYARRARGERARPDQAAEHLTPTEDDVARLAAAGLSNPEIGARLFMSRGTVKVHLTRVYQKLGVSNRTELATILPAEPGR